MIRTIKRISEIPHHPHTRIVWFLLAILAVLDVIGLKETGMSLEPRAFFSTGVAIVTLLTVAAIYTKIRRDLRIATLAHMVAVASAFTIVATVLSYLTVEWHRPLVDSWLVAADRETGLNWLAAYRWVFAHSIIHAILIVAYCTLIAQMIFLPVALNFLGMTARCWEMQWMYMLSCISCIVVSAIWPSTGAFAYFHVQLSEPYLHTMAGLRDGSIKVIGRESLQGIISFPSLHAALAIIYMYTARGLRYLFPLLLVTNVLLFASTPAIGGHHFADLWGGVAVTIVAILLVKKMSVAGLIPADEGTSSYSLPFMAGQDGRNERDIHRCRALNKR